MNRLDQFLNIAARPMRAMPAAAREDELRELRGHLEQRAKDYLGAGMSDDAAQMRALEGLGSPRKLGASLCDAWEGIAFSWWRLAAAIAGVTAFLLFGTIVFVVSIFIVPTNSEIALLPEVVPLLCTFYIVWPLFCGLLFSHWLGRRGCIVATLYFLALALGNFRLSVNTNASTSSSAPLGVAELLNAAWFPYLWVALAFVGAWAQHVWRTQMRYDLATVGAHMSERKRLFWMQFNLKLWRNVLLLIILVSALYPLRVWIQFHPQTPRATLKNFLLTAGPQGFAAPEILELRELPPANAAERAGKEQRIYLRVAASAKPYFAASQIKYLQGQSKVEARTKYGVFPETKSALANVKRNHQIIEGTVKMTKTPDGWQRDKKSYDESKLWAWFYGL